MLDGLSPPGQATSSVAVAQLVLKGCSRKFNDTFTWSFGSACVLMASVTSGCTDSSMSNATPRRISKSLFAGSGQSDCDCAENRSPRLWIAPLGSQGTPGGARPGGRYGR